jgi:hypothetical protein
VGSGVDRKPLASEDVGSIELKIKRFDFKMNLALSVAFYILIICNSSTKCPFLKTLLSRENSGLKIIT